jgi:intracellular sulfur oxidation DsrE/DsrF family protein
MIGRNNTARVALASVVAFLIAVHPSVAQDKKQASVQTSKRPAAEIKPHRLVLQVNSKDAGEKVEIEVVTFGPGLHMLREDTSPVKARVKEITLSTPAISFKACGNTQENMKKAESKEISLISDVSVVKSGVVRVMELQERGWTYVRP